MNGDHPNDSIIEDGQNTEKGPGDLRRLAVTQTPVKSHQLTLMWKTLNTTTTTTTTNNNNNNNNNKKKKKKKKKKKIGECRGYEKEWWNS